MILNFRLISFFKLLEFDKDFVAVPYADRRVTATVLQLAMNDAGVKVVEDGVPIQKLLAKHMS